MERKTIQVMGLGDLAGKFKAFGFNVFGDRW